jgi:hypothetical protein
MTPGDAFAITGAHQLISYTGYGSTFKFRGIRDVPFDEPSDEVILAIDASIGRRFSPDVSARDINKAPVGFALASQFHSEAVVSIGGWGTGRSATTTTSSATKIIAAPAVGVKLVYSAYFQPIHEKWYHKLSDGVARAAPSRVSSLGDLAGNGQ